MISTVPITKDICLRHRSKILITISFNFSVSDFTHALSKAHEQHAEDLSNLVEDFRTKNVELLRDR